MSIDAKHIEQYGSDPGTAYWRAIATTDRGRFFVKLPFVDPTGGHDGAWKEYIALSVARRVGLPFLEPHAIRVSEAIVPSTAPPIFWGNGDVFCGTPLHDLVPARTLDAPVRAVLFGVDNLLHNGDRARPGAGRNDYWLGPDGLVLLDLDMVSLPTSTGDMLRSDYFAWFSGFLVRDLDFSTIRTAIVRIGALLSDDFIQTTVASAASEWPRVSTAAAEWLRARRDALLTEATRSHQDINRPRPWL